MVHRQSQNFEKSLEEMECFVSTGRTCGVGGVVSERAWPRRAMLDTWEQGKAGGKGPNPPLAARPLGFHMPSRHQTCSSANNSSSSGRPRKPRAQHALILLVWSHCKFAGYDSSLLHYRNIDHVVPMRLGSQHGYTQKVVRFLEQKHVTSRNAVFFLTGFEARNSTSVSW